MERPKNTRASESAPRMPDAPEVPALKVNPRKATPWYDVTIKCPYCHRPHLHGWDGQGSSAGHRHSHCHQANGYTIRIPEHLQETTR